MKKDRRALIIIILVIVLISLSSEFASMAKQVGLKEALLGFALLAAFTAGLVYLIRRGRR